MGNQYYHTQKKRKHQLTHPIICTKENAWLGEAYYFWIDEADAVFWGNTSKRRTREFEVYKAQINFDDILDTVFNKDHYFFWISQVEKAAKNFVKKTGIKPTLKEINDFFKEKGAWDGLDGIQFQDISNNPNHFFVKEFQYKKRIQVAIYNAKIIINFVTHFDDVCV